MPDNVVMQYKEETFPSGWNPPPEVTHLIFYDCTFTDMPTVWPTRLTDLTLDTCQCNDQAPWSVPDTLRYLKLGFQSLCPARLPAGLQTLYLRKFRAERLPDLPAGLKALVLLRGSMHEFPDALPPTLEHLHLYRSAWRSLPQLPDTLQKIVLEEQYLARYPVGSPNLVVRYDEDCEFGDA
jgi:hypothetical protein